ncbi:MAG: hypothetical protein ACRDK4_15420 [Solirubrobacteraceae bacterium]
MPRRSPRTIGPPRRELRWSLGEQARVGDHRWWISDLEEFKRDYPGWGITRGVLEILGEIYERNAERWMTA